ncbi:MAG: protein kinase [Nitrospirae bacterium]|nr:protein kinase [Nitrospirota bacterium]
MNYSNYCITCMHDTCGKFPCAICGSEQDTSNPPPGLQPYTVLNGQYLIGKCLGLGGFGVTYIGLDLVLKMKVVIKEFLPRHIARRDTHKSIVVPITNDFKEDYDYSLSKFIDEAQTLARFNHQNIVPILFFFKEKNTAYFIMRYIPGCTLEEHVRRHPDGLSEEEMLDIIMPVLDGLEEVHKAGVLHRDIKPKNIFMSDEGKPILLDFGAARYAISNKLSIWLTHSFAPLEQYAADTTYGHQGPWSDIYACAATMYSCLQGYNFEKKRLDGPTRAPDRQNGHPLPHLKNVSKKKLSRPFADAIMKGLEMDIKQRPQTAREFQELLKGSQRQALEKKHELLILAGEFEGERIPLSSKPLIVGRNPRKSSLVFSDTNISGTHVQFHSANGMVYVMDMQSTLGTYINDTKRISPFEIVVVTTGETVSLGGRVVFKVVERDS